MEVAVIVDTADSGGGLCAIRDSRNRQGAVLAFSPAQWRVFTGKVKAERLGLVP